MTDKTPEALEIAAWLEQGQGRWHSRAPQILRRQHQRIEELEKALLEAVCSLNDYRAGIEWHEDYDGVALEVAHALLSTTQAREHQPGCDALGGYGHGVGPCSCTLSTTQQEDSQACGT
ncbi:hypothetical protein [Roseateles depolymerans]|uniref:hypothetical protein n=1 Tax=Roseateles depolymerans TaxID=76731 RepID=UPI0011C04B80|nr:hypothetical protein [Roseateles depolymerans]